MYIYQKRSWPRFRWDQSRVSTPLAAVRHRQGRLTGRMESLGFQLRKDAVLATLAQDVLKSSEIEGEFLDREQVRSSIARRLGVDIGALTPADRDVEGIVDLVLDATQGYDRPLTTERLFGWHAALFPTGRSGMRPITVGAWRDDRSGPMQVTSGTYGKERVHFEAPAAARVDREVARFLDWFEGPPDTDPVLKAALAHLRFVTIHPFDDGNGRIARAIADMALARSDGSSSRFYSMSAQIRIDRSNYYQMLEETQKGTLDVTGWVAWFLGCLDRAFDKAETTLAGVFKKAEFWKAHRDEPLNERQRDMLNLLLEGFKGHLTSPKWAKIAKCSQATATRDLAELVEWNILAKEAGGRSTHYRLIEPS